MDTVILAAGRGQRLADIVPNYVKPALPVHGQPLIVRAVEQAQRVNTNDRVIVVTAPQNTEMLCDILTNHDVDVIVQRRASGPADALMLGLELVRTSHVLVLMSDNVSTDEDITRCVTIIGSRVDATVGIVKFMPDIAQRFTVYNHRDGRWDEKVNISADHVRGSHVTCWCGPLVLNSYVARDVLTESSAKYTESSEYLIGKHLSSLALNAKFIPVSTYDVGTVDHWKDFVSP